MGLKRIKFRDGRRWVPEHVAAMMSGLKTHTMTHQQALDASNKRLEKDFIERAYDQIVSTHFRDNGGG